MKRFFRNIHLYLGLAAGLVIMITCFTGAALVFEKELQGAIYPERYNVAVSGDAKPIEAMVSALQAELPTVTVTSVKVYNEPTRTVELTYAEEGKDQSAQAFMNPYTGELISLYSYRNTFFYTMFALHRWLLAGDTGKLIVGISTSIFLFILITGIVLWWPENKKKLKQRLKFKWGAGWKRINHDYHIVVGFYTAIFLFAFAFTGLAWSFKWFNDGIYWITGTENKRPDPPLSTFSSTAKSISFDDALASIRAEIPTAKTYSINMAKDSVSAIAITVMPENPVHEKASDQYFVDQYTGKLLGAYHYSDRNLGQRVRSLFYPIHVGSIGGWPGRIIAFLACVAGVFFPVTGVILWLNRLKKEKKKHAKGKAKHKKSSVREVESKVNV
ncbi:MAG TPA: PepSY-associated TM helix domain-containing protein [Chryseosolibacter sp.]